MAAFRQQSEGVLVFEFRQANRALQRPLPDFDALHVGVHEGGERGDDRRVEPTRRPPGSAVVLYSGTGEDEAAAEALIGALARVDGEDGEDDEEANQDD